MISKIKINEYSEYCVEFQEDQDSTQRLEYNSFPMELLVTC